MTTAAALPVELILKLKEKKWSNQALADRFKVSVRTIYRVLSTNEPDKETVAFAAKLERLCAEVPNDCCRRELNRAIYNMRVYKAASPHAKRLRIMSAVESGARSIAEICEEAKLYEEEAAELIAELVEEEKLTRRAQGGVNNRGRKQMFHYFLPDEAE